MVKDILFKLVPHNTKVLAKYGFDNIQLILSIIDVVDLAVRLFDILEVVSYLIEAFMVVSQCPVELFKLLPQVDIRVVE